MSFDIVSYVKHRFDLQEVQGQEKNHLVSKKEAIKVALRFE